VPEQTVPSPRRPPRVPRERNRVLGILLASVASCVFTLVVTLVILFHYAEVHHLFAKL
jgi:hypothetical protein